MKGMDWADRIVLYGIGLLVFGIVPQTTYVVVPILVSIIAFGLITYLEETRIRTIVAVFYSLACIGYLPLCSFLPAVLYGVYEGEGTLWRLLLAWPLVFGYVQGSTELLPVGLLVLLAVLLKSRTRVCMNTQTQLQKAEDSYRELTYAMKRQNQLLLEKQDQEILGATLKERNRIAREIHDNVGHQLSSALLQVGALMIGHPEWEGLHTLKKTLDTSMDSIRTSVHNLYEGSILMEDQLRSLVDEFQFCEIQSTTNVEHPIQGSVKYAILAIVKEGLANIIKHSNATRVEIALMEHPGFYQLRLTDNGTLEKTESEDGIGLKNIRHRVDALKGHFLVRKHPGFTLFVTLPKEVSHESPDRG